MSPVLVADSKYKFVPPHEGVFWPRLFARLAPLYLKRKYCVTDIEIRGEDAIRDLWAAGHGVLLAPNHCRAQDAGVLQSLSHRLRLPFYVMASAHLFRGSRLDRWVLRRLGAFSVYREGIDRQSVQKGIDLLLEGKRPLVLFPEGVLSQSNEQLKPLQEGVAFIARSAAMKLDKADQSDGKNSQRRIYTIPVAIRYVFKGNLEATAGSMLTRIEQRLSWRPLEGQCLVKRIYRVGNALMSLKEQEYLGQAHTGELDERVNRLIDGVLIPLETEWLGGAKEGSVIARVKEIRRAILPAMVDGNLSPEELDRRWRQLTDASFAQSLGQYPARYVASRPTVDRILETVERFNEHLCGDETPHGPMHAIVQVGEPIEVSPKRDRSARVDPLLQAIEQSLTGLLEKTADECALYATVESIRK